MTSNLPSPWSRPGSWAQEVEEAEKELQSQQVTYGFADELASEFPSLAAAAARNKTNRKKNTIISSDDPNGSGKTVTPIQSKGLTYDELLRLPAGPRERSAFEIDRANIGVRFRSVGGNIRHSDDFYNSHRDWTAQARERAPSRADEIQDWRSRKSSMAANGNERTGRRGFYVTRCTADEYYSWRRNPAVESRRFDRTRSFDSSSRSGHWFRSNGSASNSDNWRKKEDGFEGPIDARTWPRPPNSFAWSSNGVMEQKQSPFGDARPREVVLAEKGLYWKKSGAKFECVKITDALHGWRNGKPDACSNSSCRSELTEENE